MFPHTRTHTYTYAYVRRCSYTYVNISIYTYTDTFASISPLIEIKYVCCKNDSCVDESYVYLILLFTIITLTYRYYFDMQYILFFFLKF